MARIRTIKPEFFCSQQVAEVSTTCRLLFIGIWCFVDDRGVHPWKPRQLKMQIFPGDDFTSEAIESMLEDLARVDLIRKFESDGACYFYVTGWHHQKIERPRYQHPAPPDSTTNRRHVADKSTNGRRPVSALPDPTLPIPIPDHPQPPDGLRPGGGGKVSSSWQRVVKALQGAGYVRAAELVREAEANGWRPSGMEKLLAEYQSNRSLFDGPGAIAERIRTGAWPASGVVTTEDVEASRDKAARARSQVKLEGLRRQLIKDGVPEARDWSHQQILEHVKGMQCGTN